jgi:hypothetical protein
VSSTEKLLVRTLTKVFCSGQVETIAATAPDLPAVENKMMRRELLAAAASADDPVELFTGISSYSQVFARKKSQRPSKVELETFN